MNKKPSKTAITASNALSTANNNQEAIGKLNERVDKLEEEAGPVYIDKNNRLYKLVRPGKWEGKYRIGEPDFCIETQGGLKLYPGDKWTDEGGQEWEVKITSYGEEEMEEQEQKFEVGSQWKTRGGWKAIIVNNDIPEHQVYKITVWHSREAKNSSDNPNGEICRHTLKGRYSGASIDHDYDLIEPWHEPLVGTCYINVNKKTSSVHDSKEIADRLGDQNRLACVEVNWSEGEGL